MPQGPFNNFEINGPLTNSSNLHGEVLFTNNVTGGERVTIPKNLREDKGIENGDKLVVTIYPLQNSTLDMRNFETTKVEVENSRNRFAIPPFIANRLNISTGDRILVVMQKAQMGE